MCLSDHKTISNMSWNAANEEGIPVRYKTSPFITSLPQDTESKIAIMVQDLPIYFFFLLLWKFPHICPHLGFVMLLTVAGTLGLARRGFLWQNKKINRRKRQLHPSNLLPTRFLHLLLSLPPPAASQADVLMRRCCGVIPGISGLDKQGIIQVEGVTGMAGLAGRVVVFAVNPYQKAI